jgi:hypothetical protein
VVIFEDFEDTILSGGKAKRRGEIGANNHGAKNRNILGGNNLHPVRVDIDGRRVGLFGVQLGLGGCDYHTG